jgi:hypothetical protein
MGNSVAKAYGLQLPLLLLVGCAAQPSQATKPPVTPTELASGTEVEVRTSIYMSARQLFEAEDFASLEKVLRAYRSERSRTPSGVWKLSVFYNGIQNSINASMAEMGRDSAFEALDARLHSWIKLYPTSPSARIAQSMIFISLAWAYRGNGDASTVKPEAWEPYAANIARAREILESNKTFAASDPHWYVTMLIVARAQGWDAEHFNNLLEEALSKEPLYYQTYFAALDYLLPKWYGGVSEIEALAQDAVKRTRQLEGAGMYARIYWYASEDDFENNIFTNSLAAWTRMKAGFDDILARYPDGWNLNNYAKFACLARDMPTTRALIERTSSNVMPDAWNPISLRQQCADWALSGEHVDRSSRPNDGRD